jgi:hypothetical protein
VQLKSCDTPQAEGDRAAGEHFASPRPAERILVTRKPLGVVGIVTPFNFPIAIPAWKIAPALVHANAVVWKPASTVPLLAMHFADALVAAGLPAGVLNLIVGPALSGLPLFRALAWTPCPLPALRGSDVHLVEAGARATPCSGNVDVRAVEHRHTPPPNRRLAEPCGGYRRNPLQCPHCSQGDSGRRNAGRFRPMVGSRCH